MKYFSGAWASIAKWYVSISEYPTKDKMYLGGADKLTGLTQQRRRHVGRWAGAEGRFFCAQGAGGGSFQQQGRAGHCRVFVHKGIESLGHFQRL